MRVLVLQLRFLVCLAGGGCASIERYDGVVPPPDASVVHAYRSVRSGRVSSAAAGGMVFCATREGLEAVLRNGRFSDQGAKVGDAAAQDDVRSALASEPALRGEPIHTRLVQGEAFLSGELTSERHATLAIYDALKVLGVGVVNAAFSTPESPAPMRAGTVGHCE